MRKLSKNCGYRVNSLWVELCKALGFAHKEYSAFMGVCTKSGSSQFFEQLIHSCFSQNYPCFKLTLSPLSTQPIITITYVKNKRQ